MFNFGIKKIRVSHTRAYGDGWIVYFIDGSKLLMREGRTPRNYDRLF